MNPRLILVFGLWLILWTFSLPGSFSLAAAAEGKRPYEMDWANRFADEVPSICGFEAAEGAWNVETDGTIATFEISKEQKLWGESVGKLTYRQEPEKQGKASVTLRPAEPLKLDGTFDAVSVWVYGNNWAWETDESTPRVTLELLFRDANGQEFPISMVTVNWKEWFLLFRHLNPELQERLHAPEARFTGIRIQNCRNAEERFLFFDGLAIRKEEFKPLTFKPRPKRGVVIPQQNQGLNMGNGRLPFPTRPETILPVTKNDAFRNQVQELEDGTGFALTYAGPDGELNCALAFPQKVEAPARPWDSVSVSWNGSRTIQPLTGGGVSELASPDDPLKTWPVVRHELVKCQLTDARTAGSKAGAKAVESVWKVTAANPNGDGLVSEVVTYTFSIQGKTLILETESAGKLVADVQYGALSTEGLEGVKVFPIPYYSYSYSGPNRPAAVCFRIAGEPSVPLFLLGNTDWYLNDGSEIYGGFGVEKAAKAARFNGGVRYRPKTDGERNPCYERFLLTISPDFEETLPTLANPVSPWKAVTGARHWYAHGATTREGDRKMWFNVHRHGLTEVVVTDHEVCFRDGGESFTFRTKAAPGKGGDPAFRDYSDFMNQEMGFVYGPYNNFTDFAPVNEYWSTDMPSRTCENQLQTAWARCYAPKPAWAVEYCEKLSPINQEKYHFRTAYCDVHTAVSSSSRVDYDSRVPGAGTQAATYYAYGEIMLLQKAAWNGPVYSEGNYHFPYCGLTDGNYAQDQGYRPAENPWLVNLDLRKIHDLCCNFGMGNPGMFYPGGSAPKADTPETRDVPSDRFFCATLAFGHPGFLSLQYGMRVTMRGYFNAQQLQSRFTQASAKQILYCGADGQLVEVSEAIASGILDRSQVVVKYSDGTVICANGSMTETMRTSFGGRTIELPPNGYSGWTEDGKVFTFSGMQAGKRCDYAVSPEYVFLDGRGALQRFPEACGSGCGVCRKVDENHREIILMEGAEVGFRIPAASAVALSHEGKEIGAASLFRSRGFTYVRPVEGAFSYLVTIDPNAVSETASASAPWEVTPGETVRIQGANDSVSFTIPKDAAVNRRFWFTLPEAWKMPEAEAKIDFCVRPLAMVKAACTAESLRLSVVPCVPAHSDLTATLNGVARPVKDGVVEFPLSVPEGANAEAKTPEMAEAPIRETFTVTLACGELTQTVRIESSFGFEFAKFPFPMGEALPKIQLNGKEPQDLMAGFGASWEKAAGLDCGTEKKDGFFTHPPYVKGQGLVFADWELDLAKLAVSSTSSAAEPILFEAFVGKRNGSDPGDGIRYRILVRDASGKETQLAETQVLTHEWKPISADLSPWQEQRITLRLITDPGSNTAGDWGTWGDLRFRATEKKAIRNVKVLNP